MQAIASQQIDVKENGLAALSLSILGVLLADKTTGSNILWATDDYAANGEGYRSTERIEISKITGAHGELIRPRVQKTSDKKQTRIRNMAEVFTPSWVCNKQNNLIDSAWFSREAVFNTETDGAWIPSAEPIAFESTGKKTWERYVAAQRIEITCGEAPYLASRYDTVSGAPIPLQARIGLLDRKLRVVNENAKDDADWLHHSIRAFQSVYGFEFQGDNLLLARENLLQSFIDYYTARMQQAPSVKLLRIIANIIAWNIWQMDGLKYVVPYSCHDEKSVTSLLGTTETFPCPGCRSNNMHRHNGVYCRVMDWRSKRSVRFIDMIKAR